MRGLSGSILWFDTILVLDDGNLITFDKKRPERIIELFDIMKFTYEFKENNPYYEKKAYVLKLTSNDKNTVLEFSVSSKGEL